MAITLLDPLFTGTAVRIFITPPAGARFWRVLRRTADAFAGPDDAGAVLVADRCRDNCILDTLALVNGTAYFWRCYSWDGAAWTDSPSATATPAATYEGDRCDPLLIVRQRLEEGLAVEVARGGLRPETGVIPVQKSPYMLPDQIVFPTVYVHQDQFSPAERFLGEELSGLGDDGDGGWVSTEGFLARSSINVGAVSRQPDERNELRRAITRILQANFPVFAAAGMSLVEFSLGDSESLQDAAAPLFMTGGTLSCLSASFVARTAPAIADVILTPAYLGMETSHG